MGLGYCEETLEEKWVSQVKPGQGKAKMVRAKLTDKERTAVEELRAALKEQLKPDYDTDFNLLRWLQEHDFDVKKVTHKLRPFLKIRENMSLKKTGTPWSSRAKNYAENYPYGLLGATGIPGEKLLVNICWFGRYDCPGTRKYTPHTSLATGYLQDCEEELQVMMAKEAETGEQWGQLLVIDLADMVVDRYVLTGPFLQMVRYVFDYFPKLIKKVVIVNAPTVFYYFWKIIGPLLPLHGIEVHFLSGKWKEEIKEHIRPDRLPVHWGGTLVDKDGDEMCREWIRVPQGPVPSSMFWSPSQKDKNISKELVKLGVHAGKAEFITVKVEKAGTTVRWYFNAHNWWTFGVYHAEDETEKNIEKMELLSLQYPVFDATYVPETGYIVCKKPGYVKLRFGNENSRFRKLHIDYKVWLEPPETSA